MENSTIFKNLNIVIPESVHKLDIEKQKDIYNYLNQMNEFEKKAYLIAMNHLGTSFNILKSNGYKEWKK
jgi:hypothetical protein